MKNIFIVLFILLLINEAFADKIIIQFECEPKKLQESFARNGKKLDLSPNDKDENSWGFLINEGNQYTIVTYKSVQDSDWEILLKCPMEVEVGRKNGKNNSQ